MLTLVLMVLHLRAGWTRNETGEQGLQLVKGAWARILVGKDRTKAALNDAKEKAGVGESTQPFLYHHASSSVNRAEQESARTHDPLVRWD